VAALITGAAAADAGEPGSLDQNEVYVELLGNTFLGANYARGVSDNVSIRVGAGLVPLIGGTALVMPTLHLNRRSRHDLEVGVGGQEIWFGDGQVHSMLSGTAGYRFRTDGGFTFRAVGSVLVAPELGPRGDTVWGVSFGKTF